MTSGFPGHKSMDGRTISECCLSARQCLCGSQHDALRSVCIVCWAEFLLINAFGCFSHGSLAMSGGWFGLFQCVRRDWGHVSEAQEVHVANGSGAPASPHLYSCSHSEPGRLPLVACGCWGNFQPASWSSGMSPNSRLSHLSLASSLCSGKPTPQV